MAVVYLRTDHSLGAAHWVAQWARWKTVDDLGPCQRRLNFLLGQAGNQASDRSTGEEGGL